MQRFYRSIYRIRRVEEEIIRLYPTDKIKSPVHLSIGQESVAVGVCEALRPQDVVFATYRGHAVYLARGGDLKAMWAELYGKADGSSRGRAGSMHLIDLRVGMMGTSAIVATSIPNSVGYAWALKQKKQDAVVASFFGDGATDEGVFHESMNFASLKRLPILFICENNGYAIYSSVAARFPSGNYCERARSYGMEAQKIENGDAQNLYKATGAAIASMAVNPRPIFIEVETCRWRDHVGPGDDLHLNYRGIEELRQWQDRDQLRMIGGSIPADEREQIEAEVEREIAEAIAFAEASPFPADHELSDHVYHP